MQTFIQDLLSFNGALFTTIHAPAGHTALLDTLMPILANDVIYLFGLLIIFLWWTPGGKSSAARAERSISREAVVWTIAAFVLALLLNIALGALLPEPRPFISFHFTPLITHSADASFPSDHTAASFAIAGILLIRFFMTFRRAAPPVLPQSMNRPQGVGGPVVSGLRWKTGLLAAVGLAMAIAIGYARVYVGVHYPLDIIGGAIVGLLAALIVTLARGLLRPVARAVEGGAHLVHLA
ncbi:MAG TPA: phosphatase PAP2 family protein [Ktedonobacterales bacterium]|jgi:undecaprenyl-diphosphatase